MTWIEEICRRFREKTENTAIQDSEEKGYPFTGEHHLQGIWEEIFQESVAPIELPSDVVHAKDFILNSAGSGPRQRILIFVSILVSINWNGWDNFLATFVEDDLLKRSDEDLPLSSSQTSFLSDLYSHSFYEQQYRFLPAYIQENGLVKGSQLLRLPFTEEKLLSNPDEPNGPSRVTKVRVAHGYYQKSGYPPFGELDLARKRCAPAEHKIMQQLRDVLKPHTRIVESLCTLEIGDDFSILLEWADGGDLSHRLHQSPTAENLEPLLNPKWSGGGARCSGLKLQAEIIEEASCLVHAVQELHSKKFRGEQCYHMDLKPANVLVYWKNFPTEVVGRWKLADFGLSVFHKIPGPKGSSMSKTSTKRPVGAYQPPEVDDRWLVTQGKPRGINETGDIWSLGGILCTVLAYALGGSEAVEVLDQRRNYSPVRKEGEDDFFYTISENSSKPELKKQVTLWLGDVCEKYQTQKWVFKMVEVIKSCLNVNAKNRPSAENLYRALKDEVLVSMGQASNTPTGTRQITTIQEEPLVTASHTNTRGSRELSAHHASRLHTRDLSDGLSQYQQDSSQQGSRAQTNSSQTSASRENVLPVEDPWSFVSVKDQNRCQLAICPSTGDVVFSRIENSTVLRLKNIVARTYAVEEIAPGNFSSAIMRPPYFALLAKGTGRVTLSCYNDVSDEAITRWLSDIQETYSDYSFLQSQIALSSTGHVVLCYTTTKLKLYDYLDMIALEYRVPRKYGHETFKTVHINLTDDLLLACGAKHFFIWKRDTETWHGSYNAEPYYVGHFSQPHTHVIHFHQRRAFLLHNDAALLGVFLRNDGVKLTREETFENVLCGAIAPDDDVLYYLKETSVNIIKKLLKRNKEESGKRRFLTLYRRSILDMEIGKEVKHCDFPELKYDREGSAQIYIRQTQTSNELIVFTSRGKAQRLRLGSSNIQHGSASVSA